MDLKSIKLLSVSLLALNTTPTAEAKHSTGPNDALSKLTPKKALQLIPRLPFLSNIHRATDNTVALNQLTTPYDGPLPKSIALDAEVVVIAGPPGAGKGTLCHGLIAKNPNFGHLSLGDEVRRILKDPEHPITKNYADDVKNGKLLPDSVVRDILKQSLIRAGQNHAVILLDGYPRTAGQLNDFRALVGDQFSLINLELDEKSAVDRIINRKEGRADDQADTALKRYHLFRQETQPMMNQIESAGHSPTIHLSTENKNSRLSAQASIAQKTEQLYGQLSDINGIKQALSRDT